MTDTLFYDGQCPLCAKEMARLEQIKGAGLVLQDIHALDSDALPASKEQLLKVLHLEREGEMITGIDANIAAWEHTRFGALWRILRWPLVKPIARAAYNGVGVSSVRASLLLTFTTLICAGLRLFNAFR